MSRIAFTIELAPQSTQRGNFIGRHPKTGRPIICTTKRKGSYQSMVAALAWQYRPAEPWTGAIRLDTTFIVARPQSMMGAKFPDGLIPMTRRPDRDNLQKGTQDALKPCGFWKDDSQIYTGSITKFYAEKNGAPRIVVEMEEVKS